MTRAELIAAMVAAPFVDAQDAWRAALVMHHPEVLVREAARDRKRRSRAGQRRDESQPGHTDREDNGVTGHTKRSDGAVTGPPDVTPIGGQRRDNGVTGHTKVTDPSGPSQTLPSALKAVSLPNCSETPSDAPASVRDGVPEIQSGAHPEDADYKLVAKAFDAAVVARGGTARYETRVPMAEQRRIRDYWTSWADCAHAHGLTIAEMLARSATAYVHEHGAGADFRFWVGAAVATFDGARLPKGTKRLLPIPPAPASAFGTAESMEAQIAEMEARAAARAAGGGE